MGLLHKKNQQKNKDPFIRLLTPMIAGLVACVFCLVSLTWAWFTASVDTPPQTIQSANRSTSVVVYEVSQGEGENRKATKKLIKPKTTEEISLAEDTQVAENEGTIIAGETAVWELAPEKTYEVVMTGSGTASTGYCEVELSHTASGSDTVETKLYKTSAFEKDDTVKFTYNTGGFANPEGVTETEWKEYVEKSTPPTLAIASCWGKPAEEAEEQVSVMSLRDKSNKIMLLSDGDVLGIAPIPCPEAKAETEMDLEGFEAVEGTVISAAEDYRMSLTLKEGYEMPAEVIVNIDGKDYVVSTSGTEANEKAPYYNAETGLLTVPATLLHDGATVYLQATATPIPEEPVEEKEEETEEEPNGETEEEPAEEPEESLVTENPAKKEEDEEEGKLTVKPVQTTSGNGGKGDDAEDSETEEDTEDEENADADGDNTSDEDEALAEARKEKIDVSFTMAQLTIDLEKTNLPANADLVLTLAAKEGEEYPEQFIITLDKTVRDEENEDEEIEEDKKEYTINADGEDNPEGFTFNAQTGELTIESELLLGVRTISIAEGESEEDEETEGEAILPFAVKNLTFAFGDQDFSIEEDMVILFAAEEGYELPETIIITIDDEEYVIYTSEEDSEENPEGITFDAETGTLTISKELLEDAETISIAAEAVKVEDDEEGDDEEDNTTEGGSDPGDDEDTDTENGGDSTENEGGDSTGTEEGGDSTENGDSTGTEEDTGDGEDAGGDNQDTENGDTTEGENGTEDGEDTDETDTETNPDDTTEGTENGTDAPGITNPEGEEENEEGGEGDGENGEDTSGTEGENGDGTNTPTGSDSSASIPDGPETGEPASGDDVESGSGKETNTESSVGESGDSTLPSSTGEAAALPSSGDVTQSGGNSSDATAPDGGQGGSPSAESTASGNKETSSEEE